ncbi:hypothetical protein [Candidatus Skiveiella danica]
MNKVDDLHAKGLSGGARRAPGAQRRQSHSAWAEKQGLDKAKFT